MANSSKASLVSRKARSCRDMSDMHPGLRMARIEHHYAFCLVATSIHR
jgi:hypothetical protein